MGCKASSNKWRIIPLGSIYSGDVLDEEELGGASSLAAPTS